MGRKGTEAEWTRWKDRAALSLEEPERRMQALASANGFECVTLLPAFREQQARTNRPLHYQWSGHWNEAGHALAASVVAPRIAARLDSLAR
jgi:hypothetical protein